MITLWRSIKSSLTQDSEAGRPPKKWSIQTHKTHWYPTGNSRAQSVREVKLVKKCHGVSEDPERIKQLSQITS